MKYTFITFEDIKACRKSYVEVEAESHEEALEKMKNEEGDIIESHILEETEEIDPDGRIEIYDDTMNTLLYTIELKM